MRTKHYSSLVRTGLHEARDILPQYGRPDTWLTAVRVLLCFVFPLSISTFLSFFLPEVHVRDLFGAALAGGMVALADPRGSTERRSVSILGAIFGGLLFYALGRLVAGHLIGVVFMCALLGFSIGYMQNFGMAGVRSAMFWMSSAFMGSTATTTSPVVSYLDILSGGLFALLMALTFFKTPSWQRKTLITRLKDSKSNLFNDLRMATPVGRMAYRIMIASAGAVIIVYLLGLSRAEWASASAISLFFPKSTVIYKRGARNILACFLAVVACFLFITYVRNFYILALVVGVLLFLATALREVNYAAFMLSYTMFFVLVIMMGTNIGGVDLLRIRLTNVAIGLVVGLIVASLSLSAKERLTILVQLHLPLPTNEHIDDPYLAQIRTGQLLRALVYKTRRQLHLLHEQRKHQGSANPFDNHHYNIFYKLKHLKPEKVLAAYRAYNEEELGEDGFHKHNDNTESVASTHPHDLASSAAQQDLE